MPKFVPGICTGGTKTAVGHQKPGGSMYDSYAQSSRPFHKRRSPAPMVHDDARHVALAGLRIARLRMEMPQRSLSVAIRNPWISRTLVLVFILMVSPSPILPQILAPV